MPPSRHPSPLIQQFMHQKIEVTERIDKLVIGGKEKTFQTILVADNDPMIVALEAAAKAEGLYLRILMPNTMGTMDYHTNRLNVHIREAPDASHYRIEGLIIG